jgi:N-acetylmuramate 1-kinase
MDDTLTTTSLIKPAMPALSPEERLRQKEIAEFLVKCGVDGGRKIRISGDASHRRYQRIFHDGITYMLMDSPVDKERVEPFIAVCELLRDRGFSAPRVIYSDIDKGLLLLEDFGNTLFSKFFHGAAIENVEIVQRQLYNEALNILIAFARQGLDGAFKAEILPPYNEEILEREVAAFAEWFLPEILSGSQLKEAQQSWKLLWRFLISSADLTPQVLVHRDYHVDNLCWLEERDGLKRVGLLDFQDALAGRLPYDLVSLLEDARRDVPRTLQAQLKGEFIRVLELNEETFNAEYALYGAQRNAKILGYFVRLYRRDGKPRYLAMIERVWEYFMQDIQHDSLIDVQHWVNKYFDSDARKRISEIASAPVAQR